MKLQTVVYRLFIGCGGEGQSQFENYYIFDPRASKSCEIEKVNDIRIEDASRTQNSALRNLSAAVSLYTCEIVTFMPRFPLSANS